MEMKRIAPYALLMAGIAAIGLSQTPKDKYMTPGTGGSPPMQTSVTINGKEIWISYHAPSVRGRKIFGGAGALQPDNSVWRLGADQATFLHTDADLDINGLAVPKGEYTLFVDLDKGNWQLIVNKQTGQWGIQGSGQANRTAATDVGRTAMTMSKPPALVERQKITLSSAGGNKGKLQIEWENVVASVPLTVK
jgi:Protein of unknown function (DUF2911)